MDKDIHKTLERQKKLPVERSQKTLTKDLPSPLAGDDSSWWAFLKFCPQDCTIQLSNLLSGCNSPKWLQQREATPLGDFNHLSQNLPNSWSKARAQTLAAGARHSAHTLPHWRRREPQCGGGGVGGGVDLPQHNKHKT